jgi:hypothetical protein
VTGTGAWIVASCLGLATVALATVARADPTKDECVNADETAQALRASGKLRDAVDKLAVCVSPSCPGPVRNDCSERFNELEKALPSIVFAVHTPSGADLSAVLVRMDGAVLASGLDGSAIAVDPGTHTFTFEASGFTRFEETSLIREGEKGRSLVIELRPAEVAPVPAAAVPRTAEPSAWPREAPPAARDAGDPGRSTRVIALLMTGVGVVGAAVGGALALEAKSEFNTAEAETGGARHEDSVSAVHTGNVATVVTAAGGLLALGGLGLWLVTPRDSTRVGTSGSGLCVQGRFW